jgi:adenylate cyclase
MGKEIERKFLVSGNGWRKHADRGKPIRQAYLANTRKLSARVRIVGKAKATITIKSAGSGLSRGEYEYPIPIKDARSLLKLRVGRLIVKRRYTVKAGKARFEIDVFARDQRGLVIAEIELASARVKFERPAWLGREITGDKRYYNARLAGADKPEAWR